MNQKLLSIITVVFNEENNIEKTIESVIAHLTSECEYIIIDGGSTDGTIEIVGNYTDFINEFISEPDSGIYDAMNKGIARASGKWLYFINAGDELLNIPAEILLTSNNDQLLSFPVFINKKKRLLPNFNSFILIKNTLPHQGCFYLNDGFVKYNLDYPIFSDYHLNLRYYQSKKIVKCFKSPIVASHSTNGVSNSKKSIGEFYSLVHKENGFFWFLLSFIYFKLRGVRYRLFK